MTRLGLPTFQGKASYRYNTRDERCDIQSLMSHMRYSHPDTTSVTIFSSGSEGVANIEVHELLPGNQIGLVKDDNTPKIRAALTWLDERLQRMGLQRLPEKEPEKPTCPEIKKIENPISTKEKIQREKLRQQVLKPKSNLPPQPKTQHHASAKPSRETTPVLRASSDSPEPLTDERKTDHAHFSDHCQRVNVIA